MKRLVLGIIFMVVNSYAECTVIESFTDKSSKLSWDYIELGGIDINKFKKEMCRGMDSVSTIKLVSIDSKTGDITATADGCKYTIKVSSYNETASDDYSRVCKSNKVKNILSNSDGSKAIICSNGSYGTVTLPTSSICAVSNGKSTCKESYKWTIEKAAKYICEE